MVEVISALKAYVDRVEARDAEQQAQLASLHAKIAELQARIETLEQRISDLEENQCEVELIMPEEETPAAPAAPAAPEAPVIPQTPEVPQTPQTPEPAPQTEEAPAAPAAPEPEAPVAPAAPEVPAAPEPEAAPATAAKYGTPVDDIRKAISLGDRFLFQRELFGQNGELMQKTLDAINSCKSFEDAQAYIDSQFGWDKESSTYQLFLTPIHRRFS